MEISRERLKGRVQQNEWIFFLRKLSLVIATYAIVWLILQSNMQGNLFIYCFSEALGAAKNAYMSNMRLNLPKCKS